MGGEASQAIKNLIAFGRIDKPGFKIEVPKGRQSAENSIRNAAQVSAGRKALKDANEEFADILKQSFDGKGNWDGLLMNVPEAKFQTTGKIGEIFTRVSEGFFNFAVKYIRICSLTLAIPYNSSSSFFLAYFMNSVMLSIFVTLFLS